MSAEGLPVQECCATETVGTLYGKSVLGLFSAENRHFRSLSRSLMELSVAKLHRSATRWAGTILSAAVRPGARGRALLFISPKPH